MESEHDEKLMTGHVSWPVLLQALFRESALSMGLENHIPKVTSHAEGRPIGFSGEEFELCN